MAADWKRRLVLAGVLSLAATAFAVFGAYQFVHASLLLLVAISPGYWFGALFGAKGVVSSLVVSLIINWPYYTALIWALQALARQRAE